MLFKELKSCYKLECISSGKECIVEALIYTALLTLIVSRRILSLLRDHLPGYAPRMKTLRWARIFLVAAPDVLKYVLIYQGINPEGYQPLFDIFVAESINPNANRESILDPWINDFAKD